MVNVRLPAHCAINNISTAEETLLSKIKIKDRIKKCRQLNPCISSIGIISKDILDNIIPKVRIKTNLQQRKNSADVLEWFESKKKNIHIY